MEIFNQGSNMRVQNNGENNTAFVMTMLQHTGFVSAVSGDFRNELFPQITASDLKFVIAAHDSGWTEEDPEPTINPPTQLPYHLTEPHHLTEPPFTKIVNTRAASTSFNSMHSAFSGLIPIMHTTDLLNGR